MLWKSQKIKQTKEALTNELGRVPTKQEISNRTGLSIKQIETIRTITMPPHSLYEQIGDEDFTLADVIEDNGIDFENETANADERRYVRTLIKGLPAQQYEMIVKHFFKGMTYREIGEQSNLTRERVRQIINEGLKKLRGAEGIKELLDDELDKVTSFYQHRGIKTFNNTWTSSTEQAVLERERYKEQLENAIQLPHEQSIPKMPEPPDVVEGMDIRQVLMNYSEELRKWLEALKAPYNRPKDVICG